MKSKSSASVIGDLIGSRRAADRSALHASLARVLDEVNTRWAPTTPVRLTVGDEYQGGFATVGEALRATLWLRLRLLPDHDVRHGVGWGPTQVLAEEPRVEDGPGWWAARAAIVAVEAAESRPATRLVRTSYAAAPDADGPDPHAVCAALALRDQLVGGLSPRSVSVLRGLLDGEAQQDVAAALGISASAVSQRVRSDGLGVVVAAHEMMGEIG